MKEKLLLTGHKGFIGSALVPKLRKKGYDVYLLDLQDMDLKRYDAVRRWVEAHRPEFVIHLASSNSIMYSYDHYVDVMETNFLATANLAEACAQLKNFRQFIFPSSTEVYGSALKSKNGRLGEESGFMPNNPHAVSKIASEIYLEYLGRMRHFPYTILRFSNTYGRTADSNFLIEGTISKMLAGSRSIKFGDPNVVRDYLFIDDHVRAYMKALGNRKAIGQAINVCTGVGHTTEDVVKRIAKLTNFKGALKWRAMPERPNEAKIVIGSNLKARSILDWKPEYDLEEGLRKTTAYWKKKFSR